MKSVKSGKHLIIANGFILPSNQFSALISKLFYLVNICSKNGFCTDMGKVCTTVSCHHGSWQIRQTVQHAESMAWERLKPHEILTRIPRDTEGSSQKQQLSKAVYLPHTALFFSSQPWHIFKAGLKWLQSRNLYQKFANCHDFYS